MAKERPKKSAKPAHARVGKRNNAKTSSLSGSTRKSPRRAARPRSREVEGRADALADWRSVVVARVRTLIQQADPDAVEEVKWRKPSNAMAGVPVWSHAGVICTGETYRDKVKLTFAKGASLTDPGGLFNSGLDGGTRRAIDIHEGDTIDETALKDLIRAAAALNIASADRPRNASASALPKNQTRKPNPVRKAHDAGDAAVKPVAARPTKPREAQPPMTSPSRKMAKPVLLSGGNPQIAKADGDEAVQAYIAAMPGWKSDIGRRLDAIITRTLPKVRKAVKWNSPFYGVEGPTLVPPSRDSGDHTGRRVSPGEPRRARGQSWFLSFHCFAKYVKVGFFRGTSLRPPPPGKSKQKLVRYLDIHEHDPLDEIQFAGWVRQASELPGWDGT